MASLFPPFLFFAIIIDLLDVSVLILGEMLGKGLSVLVGDMDGLMGDLVLIDPPVALMSVPGLIIIPVVSLMRAPTLISPPVDLMLISIFIEAFLRFVRLSGGTGPMALGDITVGMSSGLVGIGVDVP